MMVTRRRSQIPGSRFNPTSLQLIDRYLRWRKEGKSSSYIYEMNIYEKEPWLLQHVRHFRSKRNMWFYFFTRTKADSKRMSRVAGAGTWKSNGHVDIKKDGVKVGTMQLISFRIKDEKTGWVMHEYILDDHQVKQRSHQEVVLCTIKFKPGKDKTLYAYAPRFEPIVIGQPQPQPPRGEEENQNRNDVHVAAAEDIQYLGAPPPRESQQGIEQHRDLGSYGQLAHQQSQILGLVEGSDHQHHGYGYMAEYYNQPRRQEMNGSHTAHPYDPSQLPMELQEQYKLAVQHQQLRMEQHQRQILGLVEGSDHQHHGYGYMAEYYNQPRRQEMDGSHSAHPYDPSQLPMELQEQYILAVQHQQLRMEQHQRQIIGQATHVSSQLPVMMMNQSIEEHQYGEPYHQRRDLSVIHMETQEQDNMVGNLASQLNHEGQNNVPLMTMNRTTETPHLTQKQQQPCAQATTNNLMHEHYGYGNMAEYLNHICRQETDPPLSAQAIGVHHRIGSSGLYSAQHNDQNHQNVTSFKEDEYDYNHLMHLFEGLPEDTDPSQLPMELQEEYILGDQYQNFSMEQQQHQINGQATHLSSQLPVSMNQAIDEPHYCQPYHQSNHLSVVPMETQQQGNEEQDNVPLMTTNQTTEPPQLTQEQQKPCEQATTRNELTQEMDPEIASLLFGQNITVEEAMFMSLLRNL